MKYGADMAVDIIRSALTSAYGSQVSATIIGDGEHFHLFEDAFGNDARVEIDRRFASQTEIASLHKEHGIFIVPTRLDSQGVSRDEAMSSGLVPVTNSVTAIPEFVDSSCALLGEGERSDQMYEELLKVFESPQLFLDMSEAAAARVRSQSGPANTVVKEIDLIQGKEEFDQ